MENLTWDDHPNIHQPSYSYKESDITYLFSDDYDWLGLRVTIRKYPARYFIAYSYDETFGNDPGQFNGDLDGVIPCFPERIRVFLKERHHVIESQWDDVIVELAAHLAHNLEGSA